MSKRSLPVLGASGWATRWPVSAAGRNWVVRGRCVTICDALGDGAMWRFTAQLLRALGARGVSIPVLVEAPPTWFDRLAPYPHTLSRFDPAQAPSWPTALADSRQSYAGLSIAVGPTVFAAIAAWRRVIVGLDALVHGSIAWRAARPDVSLLPSDREELSEALAQALLRG